FNGEVIVKVQASRNVDQDMTVPFSITGSLEQADYTVAGESVVIKQGTKEVEIKVSISKELSEDDFLQIELGSVGGNTVLAKSKTRLSVTPEDVIIYSFDKENYEMSESVLVTLDLKTSTGSFIAEEDMTFAVELAEGSTAVEGEHFEFDGAAEIIVPAGKS